MSRSLRLFVAAYPPRGVAERWLAAGAHAVPAGGRKTPAEQVHLTLVFLGDRDERELPVIRESIARSAAGFGPIVLRPAELVMLPEKGEARLIAATTDLPPPLAEIQRRLAQRLALDRSRKSVFRPHFTLARFPGGAVERQTGPLPIEEFQIPEIRLMRSRLRVGGAEHELDKAFPLQPR